MTPPADPPSLCPKPRVLVIDDEPQIGRTLRLLLMPHFDVVSVTSARDALDLLSNGAQFDVVLCDLMMPKTNGEAFYREILRRSDNLASRTIFMTGGVFTEEAEAFLDSIPNARIDKPFEMAALVALIHRIAPRG